MRRCAAFGLDPAKIEDAAMRRDVTGFVEIHIEQGPVLEAEGIACCCGDGHCGADAAEPDL